jgi:ankyrin repeat protein
MNEKDKDGNTPLHYACIYNRISCVRILLNYNADVNIKNNNGKTPYDICNDDMIKEMIETNNSKQ